MENVTTFFKDLGNFIVNMSTEQIIISMIIIIFVTIMIGFIATNAYIKYWRKHAPRFYGELLEDVLHEKDKAKERRNK